MTPFKEWCRKNCIGITTGYKMLNRGEITAVKVGKLTFITDEADNEWRNNLPKYETSNSAEV